MGGIIDRVPDLPVGSSTTLDLLVSDLLGGALIDITESQGETLPYLRRTYLPPEGVPDSEWPWQAKLENLLKENNGFFWIEVAPGHTKHFIIDGAHRLPFYFNEMVPRSGGQLTDLLIPTKVSKVAPRDLGKQSVNIAAGKPHALCFRFLPVLQLSICTALSDLGYSTFEEGDMDRPIPEINYEFVNQILIYLQNQESFALDGKATDATDMKTPSWLEELPWLHRYNFLTGLKELATKLVKSTSSDYSIERLASFSHTFNDDFLGSLFSSAIETKLDRDNYQEILTHRLELSAKTRLISLLNVAMKRELFDNLITEVQSTLEQVNHLPLSTLRGYNEIIIEMEKGAREAGLSVYYLLNLLGGRSYGSGKESYGPVRDSYLEMPSTLGEPYRTEIITHILDSIYSVKTRNRGHLRRETVRRIRTAWTAEPYDRQEFADVLRSADIEYLSAYLPLSRFLPASSISTIIEGFHDILEHSEEKYSPGERIELFYQFGLERAARCRELLSNEVEVVESPAGAELSDVDRFSAVPLPDYPVTDPLPPVQNLIPTLDLLEALLETTTPAPADLLDPENHHSQKEPEEMPLGGEPDGKNGYNFRFTASSRIATPQFDTTYLTLLRNISLTCINQTFQINPTPADRDEVLKLIAHSEDDVLSHRRILNERTAVNIMPDWLYLVLPRGHKIAIASLIPGEEEQRESLEMMAEFDQPLIIEANFLLPEISNVEKYPYNRLWLARGVDAKRGNSSEVVLLNGFDPLLREPQNTKYLLASQKALCEFYCWASSLGEDLFS